MEPGLFDREDRVSSDCSGKNSRPQWSPVFLTGKTAPTEFDYAALIGPSMEPGLFDREDPARSAFARSHVTDPQWSPVFLTGKTPNAGADST